MSARIAVAGLCAACLQGQGCFGQFFLCCVHNYMIAQLFLYYELYTARQYCILVSYHLGNQSKRIGKEAWPPP